MRVTGDAVSVDSDIRGELSLSVSAGSFLLYAHLRSFLLENAVYRRRFLPELTGTLMLETRARNMICAIVRVRYMIRTV